MSGHPDDERLFRRMRNVVETLVTKGELTFPAAGWEGWSDTDFEEARRDLDYILLVVDEELGLTVTEDEEGTVHVRLAFAA